MKNNVNLNTHLKPTAMKKLVLTFVLVMVVILAKSQTPITITGSDMPQPGTADLVGNDTTSKHFSFGTASATFQSWDFSNLANSYPKVAIYSPTSPYQAFAPSFPVLIFIHGDLLIILQAFTDRLLCIPMITDTCTGKQIQQDFILLVSGATAGLITDI